MVEQALRLPIILVLSMSDGPGIAHNSPTLQYQTSSTFPEEVAPNRANVDVNKVEVPSAVVHLHWPMIRLCGTFCTCLRANLVCSNLFTT